ncbi:hypothetical protein [Anaerosporobacter faecicola]|uniref:hypothetical protein n=1 Tax=Anaerosporobacter faecicola TaxID=2718714 RepID=UPI0014391B91|nr:hypothetical protein [Anaerosporobacter faecicola]
MNAFGKIVAIFVAVLLLFLCPIQYVAQKQDLLMQQHITMQTTYFVDSIRNLGYVTRQMYEEYQKNIQMGAQRYEIEITQYHLQYVLNNGEMLEEDEWEEVPYSQQMSTFMKQYHCFYTEDLLTVLYETEEKFYPFHQGDYITVKVKEKTKSLAQRMQEMVLGTNPLQEQYVAIYGGMIRDEAYEP